MTGQRLTSAGLDGISHNGRVGVLAIDHRDSLRSVMNPDAPETVSNDDIVDLKRDLIEGAADLATGVMLEPEFSIPDLVSLLPEGVGFSAALEAQGYMDDPGGTPTSIMDGWSPAQARDCGASIGKLLIPYRPDHARADEQLRITGEIVDECRREDLPILLEPLFFGDVAAHEREDLVITTARQFTRFEPDLLKLPYPGSAAACATVTDIVTVPWVMLSGGGSFDTFAEQLETAVAAGAVGFMVGRALWGDAVKATGDERRRLIVDVVRPRLEQLRMLAQID